MKFKAAALAVVVVCSSVGWGQSRDSDGVVAKLDPVTDQLQWNPTDRSELQKLDIDQDKLLALLEAARAYQESHNEALGLEYRLNDIGRPELIVRADLSADVLLVSPETLLNARADGFLSPRPPGFDLPSIPDLQKRLEAGLKQKGAFEASNTILGPAGQQQTVDPVLTGFRQADVVRLRQQICPNQRDNCLIDGVRIDVSALIRVADETGQQPDLVNCKKAQNDFRVGVEFNSAVSTNPYQWRSVDGAEDLAMAFDTACLTGPDEIPSEVLEGVAILRMPGQEAPFCTAFRVGPTQFVTAKHCFHNPKTGLRLTSRLNAAELFLYNDPTRAIEIDRSRLPDIPDTSSRAAGVQREIPARDDFAVLHTVAFDTSTRTVTIAAPVIGSQIVVPGHFLFADRRNGPPVSAATWASEVRITTESSPGYCRVYDIEKPVTGPSCLVHRCQVMPGFSGSPLLQLSAQGDYQLIGIHVRDEGGVPHHCPGGFTLGSSAPIARYGNFAALVTPANASAMGYSPKGGPP